MSNIAAIRGTMLVALVGIIILASLTIGTEQTSHVYQVGAWGDDTSRRNLGVQAEIQTNAYEIETYDASQPRVDSFWVGSNLENGAFIQFGYVLGPGYYCLKGMVIKGTLTCLGRSELVKNLDPRWEWQYWPEIRGEVYYYEDGLTNSGGQNGTWHRYSIIPKPKDGWSFVLDGQEVANVNFQPSRSKEPMFVFAEQSTTVALSRLGPVKFRNLSYLSVDGWHSVSSLRALVACGVSENCDNANAYGVASIGPGAIIAGSTIEKRSNLDLLWSIDHPGTPAPLELVGSVLVAVVLIVAIVIWNKKTRRVVSILSRALVKLNESAPRPPYSFRTGMPSRLYFLSNSLVTDMVARPIPRTPI